MKQLYDGNLIYLNTFKAVKNMKKTMMAEKNRYFKMNAEGRAREKYNTALALQANPNDLKCLIYVELMKEVDNG